MNTLLLFALEVILCLGMSLVLTSLLRPLLKDVLIDTCVQKKGQISGLCLLS